MSNRKLLIIAIIFIVGFNQIIRAQEVTKTGTTAAKFLSIGIGPRANAMGGAFSSISNDVSGIYWNPAGISDINQFSAMFAYTKMFADINLDYVGLVIPMPGIANFGLSVTYLNVGNMAVTTELEPEGNGETFSAGSYAFALTAARNVTQEFSVGVNIKYIRESIFNSYADGFAFDVGTIFKTPFYGVRFASSISNYGSKMQMGGQDLLVRHTADPTAAGSNNTLDANLATDQFDLPLHLQIGLSRDFEITDEHRFTIAVDAIHPNDNSQYVNVGGELSFFNDLFCVRGGYKALFLKDSQEGLTLGVGVKYEGMRSFKVLVDYSYQRMQYLDNLHSFGVQLSF